MSQQHRFHVLLPFIGLALVGAAAWVIADQLREYTWQQLVEAFERIDVPSLTWAGIATAAAYSILTAYDHLAMRYIRSRVSFPRIAFAAFIGYAFSNSIGHSWLTGGSVRYRLYTAWGVPMSGVLKVVIFGHVAFYLGMLIMIGAACVGEPGAIAAELPFAASVPHVQAVGGVLLALAAGYLLFVTLRRAPIRVRGMTFDIPTPSLSLATMIVATVDLVLYGLVLWLLLPPIPGMSILGFLGLFIIAQVISLGSQAPGGLGVFETIMLHILTPELNAPDILAAVLVYRLLYCALPLALGGGMLALYEVQRKRTTRADDVLAGAASPNA